jgi:hypothetical protein
MSSVGQSALAQADKMGTYYLHGYYNRRPAYQVHTSHPSIFFLKEQNIRNNNLLFFVLNLKKLPL